MAPTLDGLRQRFPPHPGQQYAEPFAGRRYCHTLPPATQGLNLFSLCEETAPLTTLRSAIDEHAHILHAIEHHDPEAAKDSMRMHLRCWQEFFEDLFEREAEAINDAPNLLVFHKA